MATTDNPILVPEEDSLGEPPDGPADAVTGPAAGAGPVACAGPFCCAFCELEPPELDELEFEAGGGGFAAAGGAGAETTLAAILTEPIGAPLVADVVTGLLSLTALDELAGGGGALAAAGGGGGGAADTTVVFDVLFDSAEVTAFCATCLA